MSYEKPTLARAVFVSAKHLLDNTEVQIVLMTLALGMWLGFSLTV